MSVSDGARAGLRTADLVGRDVGILGTGREGVAVWRRLRVLAPDQSLTLYSEAPPPPTVRAELGPLDQLVVGPLEGERLGRHEILVRSPGVSPYRDACRVARDAGARFTSGTNLWLAENPEARTLCVTGTKGKSTTASLLRHLLSAAGQRAEVVGNIGVPLADCDPADADWWVVELSSYQLCDLVERPWLGLLLNLSDEHLDWHGGVRNYRADKLRLADLAAPGRVLANRADAGLVAALGHRSDVRWFNDGEPLAVRDGALWDGAQRLPGLPAAPGGHNLHNLAAALAVVDFLGLRPEDLRSACESFRGLPHRQSRLGTDGGLEFMDDSLATTPVATLAALEALPGGPVTILVGGLDRGLDWGAHVPAFRRAAPHAVVGLPDSGAAILATFRHAGFTPPGGLHLAHDMRDAVRLARRVTPEGGTVLLSPGAPSFPRYRDYRERAEAFRNAAFGHGRAELGQPGE